MTATTNAARSTRINNTMVFYVRKQLHETYNTASQDENLTDLLTDMMHFATFNSIEFGKCLRMAENNFETEQTVEVRHGM